MKKSYPYLELLNYEGPVLAAYRKDSTFVIVDQWKNVVEILNLDQMLKFIDGTLEIIDSKNKHWNFKQESIEAQPKPEVLTAFCGLDRDATYEERIAWFVANYYETGMEYSGMLESMRDENLDAFKWYDEIVKIPRKIKDLRVKR